MCISIRSEHLTWTQLLVSLRILQVIYISCYALKEIMEVNEVFNWREHWGVRARNSSERFSLNRLFVCLCPEDKIIFLIHTIELCCSKGAFCMPGIFHMKQQRTGSENSSCNHAHVRDHIKRKLTWRHGLKRRRAGVLLVTSVLIVCHFDTCERYN